MNFFQYQAQARRNTTLLVFLFTLAVASLILLTNIFLVALLAWSEGIPLSNWPMVLTAFSWQTFSYIALGTCSVVFLASLFKLFQLSGGGRSVAEAMGGRLINLNTRDADERKVLNVVEEMAIASGTPVPAVYVIEEEGINAFAAGYDRTDAVIGVTQGCVQQLSRDELQGVVAHEFSHIFNGDMRLNLRLIMILHGILIIGIAGFHLLRVAAFSGHHGRSGKTENKLPLLALGAGFMAIGYLGSFFGNMIKAAVSRQREFLADASAVQFTRNPDGIGGALKKIGGFSKGSAMDSPGASELSHLFFGQAVTPFFNSLMATHPPLAQRIARIQPGWRDDSAQADAAATGQAGPASPIASHLSPDSASHAGAHSEPRPASMMAFSPDARPVKNLSEALIAGVGQVNAEGISAAHRFLAALPTAIVEAAHEPYGARALVYCLLLDADPQIKQKQWAHLARSSDPEVYRLARQLDSPHTQAAQNRLSLLDLCLPVLKQLTKTQNDRFMDNLVALIQADEQVAMYEWALFRIIQVNLEGRRGQAQSVSTGPVQQASPTRPPGSTAAAASLILSSIANSTADSEPQARAAFESGKAVLGNKPVHYVDRTGYSFADLSRALDLLTRVKPLQKPALLEALCAAAAHDGVIEPVEIELIRAIADGLDCPVPPMVHGG